MKQTYPNNQKRKRLAYVSIPFVFLLLVVCQSVNSQQNFNFRNFTRAGNNISSNNIRLIAEDQFGKIWTVTDHSLNFFNGFWSTISISDTVTCLIFADKNEIWIGTDTGIRRGVLNLNRIDWIDHYTTEHGLLSNRILTMVHRKNGEIWVGTPLGTNRFDGKSWQIVLNEETRIIYEDRDSDLWFVHNTTPNFLSYFDGTNHFTFGLNDGIPNSYIQTIGQDDDGNIWVGTNKGVAIYDGLDWKIVTTADGLIGNNIKAITTDSQGSIWIGTNAGISFQGFSGWTNLTRANGLASNHVSSILSSSNGGIWVGTNDNGLSFSDRSWQPVSTNVQGNHVNVMFSDQNSIIWIGTQNGIFRTNDDDVVQVKRKFGEVREITQDTHGNLWLATSLGVEKFNGFSWERFSVESGTNEVQSICFDRYNHLWISTGVLLFDDPVGFLPDLIRYDGTTFHQVSNIVKKINRTITQLFADPSGWIYLATVGNEAVASSLWIYDQISGELEEISRAQMGRISTIINTKNGDIWVGSDNGIHILGSRQKAPKLRLTTVDGLIDNHVQTLYVDSENRVWVGTNDGVSIFQNGRFFRTLTASDGLNSNNISAIIESTDGSFWFSSFDDGTLSRFKREDIPPTTRIISGPMNGETVGETSVNFRFEGGDASSSNFRYQFQVNNGNFKLTDDHGFDNRAFLVGLTEGLHQFVVQAIDQEGNIDQIGAKSDFVVDSLIPISLISQPSRNQVINGVFDIEGTSSDSTDFSHYEIRIHDADIVFGVENSVEDSLLYRWNTFVVNDGQYQIKLVSFDQINGSYDRQHKSEIVVVVEVDNTKPEVKIIRPLQGAVISGNIEVEVLLNEKHITHCTLEYSPIGKEWQRVGEFPIDGSPTVSPRLNWDTSQIDGYSSLRAKSTDQAGNIGVSQTISIRLKNDSALPIAQLRDINQPVRGEVGIYGTAKIRLSQKTGLKSTSVEFRPVEGNINWQLIYQSQLQFNSEEIFRWDTSEIHNGRYFLRLVVVDHSEYRSISEIEISLDNVAPTVVIDSPKTGNVLRADIIPIIGTINDLNFDTYVLEYLAPNDVWVEISRSAEPLVSSKLGDWNAAQLIAGEYQIRATAFDQAGNFAQTIPPIEIVLDDTQATATLTKPESNTYINRSVQVYGIATDENFDRYILDFRSIGLENQWHSITVAQLGGLKEESLLANWRLSSLNDGIHEIRLTVFDKTGQSSQDQVRVIVDSTIPKSIIISPVSGQQVPQNISIIGSAYDLNFKKYTIEYGAGKSPVLWRSISKIGFLEAVLDGTLAEWNSPNLIGEYTLRLTVEDQVGQTSNHQIQVSFKGYVDNQRIEHVESLDGHARLIFPPNCLTEQTIVTINPTTHGYEFAPRDLQLNPRKPATIEFTIHDMSEKIGIFRWDDRNDKSLLGSWELIGGTSNYQERTISTTVTKLGQYAVLELANSTEEYAENPITSLNSQPRLFSPNRGEETAISFQLNKPGNVTIKIYNIAGRLRRSFEGKGLISGNHVFWWDGRDNKNNLVVSNIYIITVETGNTIKTKTVVVKNN